MNRRLFMGAFTAGAVTVAVGSADGASAADRVTVFNGQVSAQSFYADGLGGQAACFTTASKAVDYAHALVAVQNGTTGFEADGVTPKLNGGSAINAVSKNPDTSAMYLTGVEKGAAVSTAASGGKSQAGRHGSASGTSAPNSGGTGTADTASGGKSTAGTATANTASGGKSAAGSGNASSGQATADTSSGGRSSTGQSHRP